MRITLHGAMLAATLLSACSKEGAGSKPASAAPPVDVVAQVGPTAITVAEVERRLAQQPDYVRVRYATPERRAEFLDQLVKTELLVQEARRQGLEQEPEVREVLERVLVQKLLQKQLEASPVGEGQARAFYDANLTDYVRPERLRLAQVIFASSRTDSRRAAVKAEAQKELAALLAAKDDVRGPAFAALVRKRSNDEATRATEGDLGPRTKEELAQLQGGSVAEVAFALSKPGDLTQLVESDKGFHILRLLGRQPGETTTFEAARARIENRLQAEGRGKTLEGLVGKLKASTKVEVHADKLAQVKVQAPGAPLVPAAKE